MLVLTNKQTNKKKNLLFFLTFQISPASFAFYFSCNSDRLRKAQAKQLIGWVWLWTLHLGQTLIELFDQHQLFCVLTRIHDYRIKTLILQKENYWFCRTKIHCYSLLSRVQWLLINNDWHGEQKKKKRRWLKGWKIAETSQCPCHFHRSDSSPWLESSCAFSKTRALAMKFPL